VEAEVAPEVYGKLQMLAFHEGYLCVEEFVRVYMEQFLDASSRNTGQTLPQQAIQVPSGFNKGRRMSSENLPGCGSNTSGNLVSVLSSCCTEKF
jgi:hypothetical protein